MKTMRPMTDEEGEVRTLTAADLALFHPASEVLDPELYEGLVAMNKKRGERGAQKKPLKVPTTIRFDADLLDALKASGKGWQTRVNDAMRDWLKTHSPV